MGCPPYIWEGISESVKSQDLVGPESQMKSESAPRARLCRACPCTISIREIE